jgi:alpha-glucosidase
MAEFVKTIPAVYDETLCLSGSEIGACAIFAKRSGKTWFLAAMNGDTGRTLKVDLSFLGPGKWKMLGFGDGRKRDKWGNALLDACTKREGVFTSADSLTLTMRDGGGYAARFTQE